VCATLAPGVRLGTFFPGRCRAGWALRAISRFLPVAGGVGRIPRARPEQALFREAEGAELLAFIPGGSSAGVRQRRAGRSPRAAAQRRDRPRQAHHRPAHSPWVDPAGET